MIIGTVNIDESFKYIKNIAKFSLKFTCNLCILSKTEIANIIFKSLVPLYIILMVKAKV